MSGECDDLLTRLVFRETCLEVYLCGTVPCVCDPFMDFLAAILEANVYLGIYDGFHGVSIVFSLEAFS